MISICGYIVLSLDDMWKSQKQVAYINQKVKKRSNIIFTVCHNKNTFHKLSHLILIASIEIHFIMSILYMRKLRETASIAQLPIFPLTFLTLKPKSLLLCCRTVNCHILGPAGVLRTELQVSILGFVQERIQEWIRVRGKQVDLERYTFHTQNVGHLRKWEQSQGIVL